MPSFPLPEINVSGPGLDKEKTPLSKAAIYLAAAYVREALLWQEACGVQGLERLIFHAPGACWLAMNKDNAPRGPQLARVAQKRLTRINMR